MKKYFVLTSVLALAACGGGSGGSGGISGGSAPAPITDRVAASNSVLTNMVSNSKTQIAIYVANKLGDDASSVGLGNAGRSATTRGAFVPSANVGSGLDYDKAQELIELAQWLGDNGTTEQDIISMFNNSKEDKNKIKAALKLMDDMYCFVGGSAEETANRIISRRSANDFVVPLAELEQHAEIMTLDGVDLFTSEGYRLKFNVDKDGKIESYEYPDYLIHNDDGTVEFNGDEYPVDDDTDGIIARKNNTNIFVQESEIPLSAMNDEDPDANIVSVDNITDVNDSIKVKLYDEYISYGKQLGLKYSDFGIMKNDFKTATFDVNGVNDAGKQEIREFLDAWGVMMTPFAGGYVSKKISDDDMNTLANNGDITFTGTAVADVRYRDGYAYNGNGIDVPLTDDLMTDDGATLVFNQGGKQTLTADFSDDWYKIQAIKDTDGKNQLVVFGDRNGDGDITDADRVTKKIDVDGDGTVRTYDFTIATSPTGLDGDYNVIQSQDSHQMIFTTGYYGDNNTPNEATATMHYQFQNSSDWDWYQDPNDNNNWKPDEHGGDGNIGVELGFGGTR